MNFLINLLYHFGTVGILFVGGWFVMQDKTEVGTVVAFVSGLTKVNDPWNDLVTFFRDMTNARVKYWLIAKVLDDQDPGEAAEGRARGRELPATDVRDRARCQMSQNGMDRLLFLPL